MDAVWAQLESIRANEAAVLHEVDEDPYMCPVCGGVKSYAYDFPTCTSCGRVEDRFLSDEAEWIGGPDDVDDPSRVGIPTDTVLYSDSWGMGTRIAGGGKTCQKMARMNLHASMNHRDRALHHAYVQFDHVCRGKLRLPDTIIDTAKVIYKKFNSEKLTRGAIRSGIKANCVLHACSSHGVARTLQEVADAFGIPVKDISRTSDLFGEETGKTQSSDVIARIFNNVTFIPDQDKGRIRMRVSRACDDAEKNPMLLGKTPKGIASAVMYRVLVAEYGPNAVDRGVIAKACDVSVPTLNKIEKLLDT